MTTLIERPAASLGAGRWDPERGKPSKRTTRNNVDRKRSRSSLIRRTLLQMVRALRGREKECWNATDEEDPGTSAGGVVGALAGGETLGSLVVASILACGSGCGNGHGDWYCYCYRHGQSSIFGRTTKNA